MLTVLADMLMAASYRNSTTRRPDGPYRSSDHWAGRFNHRPDATTPPYRFNRFRDLW
ncbi:hypothetical protein [Oceaniglobus roseus]|uniref:hypothetical protein n=1 Tax=Oceaniglobus roseus TaxID=1737570 RepID=UPI0012FFE6F6|nr:hypothetical protein [Kandeliimicrobium roseum]